MKCSVNGMEREYEGDAGRSILEYLRRDLGIISPKDGCSPQAACGCCAVRLGGKIVMSCATPMKKAAGQDIQTIEGLEERVQSALADAFVSCGGAQCGFCIPGMVMSAAGLLEENSSPTRDEIEHALRFHICRCTGYKKIVDSIERAAGQLRGEKVKGRESGGSGRIGTRLAKYDMRGSVLGQRAYVADMKVKGMLHGAVRLSDHPRARVLSINTRKAEGLAGVVRVFLAGDIPEAGERNVGLIVQDWPVLVEVGETTRFVGDVLACVAAETRDIARQAVDLIEVEYEVLEPVADPRKGLEEGSPLVHEKGNRLAETRIGRGEVEGAFGECAFISEGVYETQWIEHAYLEPEACLARPCEEGVEVFTQSQGVYEDRRQICSLLGLAPEQVKMELVPNGGGFGGKEDLCIEGQAALMAFLLRAPVHLELSRDESMRMSTKRHPISMEYKLGCNKEGELQALRARMIGDTGAYASVGMKVLERAAGHSTGAYFVPCVEVEAVTVYTNNIPAGAMRGFGANQANFAMESCVDELCEMGGFDRWQFRYDNALREGLRTATGQVLTSGVGVRVTLDAVKDVFRGSKYAGIACGLKNTGIGNGMPDDGRAMIVIKGDNEVEIHHGWTEMGQGVHTMAVQVFCEETGLPPEFVKVVVRTDAETHCGMTTASRATGLVGNAIIDACRELKKDLSDHSLGGLTGREYRGEWVCDWTTKPGQKTDGEPITHYSYSYATQVVILDVEGAVERVVAAHDAGKIMNPTLFEGQIEGSVHMGLGYALTEDFPMENGQPKSTRLRKCGILRAHETPAIEVIGVEVADEHGPYGAKGVGEIGLVPTAPAVANALFQFDGVRRRSLPMGKP